ncbi:MAG: double zinc ribbon domain-containing protein [Halobacteriota archaeon]
MDIPAECPNCWAENSSTARFCSNCGKPLPIKPRWGRRIAGGALLLIGLLFFISPLAPSNSPTPSSVVVASLVISWIVAAVCVIFGARLIRGQSVGGGR